MLLLFFISLLRLSSSSENFSEELPKNEIIQYEDINESLVQEIKDLMLSVKKTIQEINETQLDIKKIVSDLNKQIDSLEKSEIDMNALHKIVKEVKQTNDKINDQILNSVSKKFEEILNKRCIPQEIILNYVPPKPFVLRSSIKPVKGPIKQRKEQPQFVFETLFPYYCQQIALNKDFVKSNSNGSFNFKLIFSLKGHVCHSIENAHQVKITVNNDYSIFKLDKNVIFDRIVVEILNTDDFKDEITLPQIHLYEPATVRY